MANLPVNIDFHILRTATPFPNLLGPLMINDYIQGLKLGRKNDQDFLRSFGSQTTTAQHDKFNQQRILSTISAGKAYEEWCNKWWLSGLEIRDVLAKIFEQVDRLKLLGVANNCDISSVWTIMRERKILRNIIKVCCSSHLESHHDKQRENEAVAYFSKAQFPGSLTKTFMEVIYPFMDYCQEENQFAEQHGNYLKSIFGEEAEATNMLSACMHETLRDIREEVTGRGHAAINMATTYSEDLSPVISFVTCMGPLFDLADTALTNIPPTLDGFDGIAILAPAEAVGRLQSELWRNVGGHRTLMSNLRHDLFLCYILSGALITNMPPFTVDYVHDQVTGANPFRPTRLLVSEFSQEPFWIQQQNYDRQIPLEFISSVQALSNSALRVLERQRRERSPSAQSVRSEISIASQQTPKKFPASTALPVETEEIAEGGGGDDVGAGPTIALDFPLEWGLLIGVLGVAVLISAY